MPDKLTQLGSCHRALHKKRPWLAVNWKTTILIAVVTLLLYRVQSSESTWRASVGSEASSICVKGKYLYVGTLGSGIVVLDKGSGRRVRTIPIDNARGIVTSRSGDKLYIGLDNSVCAVSSDTGSVLWTAAADAWPRFCLSEDESVVYLSDEKLRAIDSRNGADLWSVNTNKAALTNLIFHNGAVYASTQSQVFAVGSIDHKVRWHVDKGCDNRAMCLCDELLVFDDPEFGLQALDAQSGKNIWQLQPGHGGRGFPFKGPLGTLIVATSSGWVYQINPQNKQYIWITDTMAAIDVPSVLGREGLYAAGGVGNLAILNSNSGILSKRVWLSSILDRFSITNSRLVVQCTSAMSTDTNGCVYVGTTYGTVYFIK